jgi:hypothetical protein
LSGKEKNNNQSMKKNICLKLFLALLFFFQTKFLDKYFWLEKQYLKERKRCSICHIYQLFKDR